MQPVWKRAVSQQPRLETARAELARSSKAVVSVLSCHAHDEARVMIASALTREHPMSELKVFYGRRSQDGSAEVVLYPSTFADLPVVEGTMLPVAQEMADMRPDLTSSLERPSCLHRARSSTSFHCFVEGSMEAVQELPIC